MCFFFVSPPAALLLFAFVGFFFLNSIRNEFTAFSWFVYRDWLGFIGFVWVLLGFTGFYWVWLGFPAFNLGFTEFDLVSLGFTEFYRVLPSFTGFYRVLLGFTEFYWVLPSFTGFSRFCEQTNETQPDPTHRSTNAVPICSGANTIGRKNAIGNPRIWLVDIK